MADLSWAETVRRVHERADLICEYCQTSQRLIAQSMHIDHILPTGDNDLGNLCLSFANCNMSKARATTAIDPETAQRVPLFNPRKQRWADHFAWNLDATIIIGLTATGRATIARLDMNRLLTANARLVWAASGGHPPKPKS